MTALAPDRRIVAAPAGLSFAEAAARQRARADTPPGCLPVHRWYLRRPAGPLPDAPELEPAFTLLPVRRPPAAYYRFLYGTVGRDWLWFERLLLDDAALEALLAPETLEVFVLFHEGAPQGYFELNRAPRDVFRQDAGADTVDLAYFGLMPWAVGKRIGFSMLRAALAAAGGETRPMTINTCTLDHPRALGLYQRAGFVEERAVQFDDPDPRLTGLMPREVAPQIPLASRGP